MTSLDLDDLPPPPAGHSGWPWTEASTSHVPEADLPRLSIVTPVLNGERWLEQSIRSVLLQGYPKLDYQVLDAGSADASPQIIERYAPFLSFARSEPDAGQTAALNEGFARADGEVYGWLNADDYYLPGALHTLATLRDANRAHVGWVGVTRRIVIDGPPLPDARPMLGGVRELADWGHQAFIPQPSCVFDAASFHGVGGLDERLRRVMDWNLWLRLAGKGTFMATDEVTTCYRVHPDAKSQRDSDARFPYHPDGRIGSLVERLAILFEQGMGDIAQEILARRLELERSAPDPPD